jgi:hypothetical protein
MDDPQNDAIDVSEALAGIRRGLADIAAGRTQPVDAAFADIRRRARKRVAAAKRRNFDSRTRERPVDPGSATTES